MISRDEPSLRESREQHQDFKSAIEEARRQALGSEEALQHWHAAINAIHEFAQATRCPAGGDVIKWFDQKTEAVGIACREAWVEHRANRHNARDGSSPQITEPTT
jgi:hypothetical protein